MRDASDRADQAAADVVFPGAAASDTVDISDAGKAGERLDDVGGLVDLRMARYQFAAGVRVLQTVDEMADDVIALASRRR